MDLLKKGVRNKKAAMELSMSTIVILVLAMVMLVLGIILIQKIFFSAGGAISSIDSGVKSEIQKAFSTEGKKIVIYPSSRKISIKQGKNNEGFAFSVKNVDVNDKEFIYNIEADPYYDFTKCGRNFDASKANSWLLIRSGSFKLPPGNSLQDPELVLFSIPETAPPCTILYNINVKEKGSRGNSLYAFGKIYLTIK